MAGWLNSPRRAVWLPRALTATAVVLLHLVVADRLPVAPAYPALPPRLQVVYLHELEPATESGARSGARQPASPSRNAKAKTETAVVPAVTLTAFPPSRAASQPASTPSDPVSDIVPGFFAADAAAASGTSPLHQELTAPHAAEHDGTDPGTPILNGAVDPHAGAQPQERAQPSESIVVADGGSPSPEVRTAFEWPVSTRLSYVLDGHYRGEVHGSAQVEWINAAPRYQVNLDVTVGLAFAPLFTRHMRSDGRMVAKGLQPEQYAEASQLAFRAPQHSRLRIEADGMRDALGRRWPVSAVAGPMAVQDSASQFVQLSWLFTVDPDLLTPGRLIEFELALPRRLARWGYVVGEPQTIHTPFGAVEAVHVQPHSGTERGSDLLAQAWFAPSLANLPVRIRIEQSADVYLDLVLERRPELAAR